MAEIQVKDVPSMSVVSLAFTGPYEQTQEKLDELASWLLRAGHPYSGAPIGLYYDDPTKVESEALRGEVCLPIEENCEATEGAVRKTLPAVTVASATHQGPYEGLHLLFYQEIFSWITENGYRYAEGQPTREVFHKIHGEVVSAEEYLTEVQVPVEKV